MVKLSVKVDIGAESFQFPADVDISSSWDMLTDTARIVLPRGVRFITSDYIAGLDNLFKRGDAVKIYIGYDGDLVERFDGYLSGIRPGNRLEFLCEDAVYLMKQKSIESFSSPKITLEDLLGELSIDTIPFNVADGGINLGKFRIRNANAAEVLEELRKTYGLYSWAREGILYCGFAYDPYDDPPTHIFEVGKNVIAFDDLRYYRDDDVKIKVKGVSLQPNNKKIEVEVGDASGDLRTVFKYNVGAAELKKFAEAQLEELKFEGYRGHFDAFTTPRVRHGDKISFKNPFIPEQDGTYYVRKVVTRVGVKDDMQRIYLDRKIL